MWYWEIDGWRYRTVNNSDLAVPFMESEFVKSVLVQLESNACCLLRRHFSSSTAISQQKSTFLLQRATR